jgi:outer membrane immunogenic protein
MRRWVVAAVLAGIAHGAQAADLPDFSDLPVLRGPFTDGLSTSTVNWQGAYVGGQFGYTSGNMDFSKATASLTNFMLQNLALANNVSGWTLLGKASPTSTSFGGFVGWNSQWDDVILGIEANYNRLSNLSGSSTNTLPLINIPAGCLVPPSGETDICGAKLSGTASAKVTDVLTLRGRAGWAIDNFLPYMFGGLALGRADVSRSATVTQVDTFYTSTPPIVQVGLPTVTTYSKSEASSGLFTYGYTAGLGLEAMLYGNVFARGEYEYVKFMTVKNVDIHLNTVRAAVGYKF